MAIGVPLSPAVVTTLAYFVLPGMGLLMFDAINQRDYPIITGLMLIIGLVVLVVNLLIDLSYGFLDPKIRYK